MPYDLIITDLSFKDDFREANITTGEELIDAIKEEQPDANIIVYSIEDRPLLIKSLFKNRSINAFVAKGRESSTELMEAINTIYHGGNYISPQLTNIFMEQVFLELDKYDVEILKLLSEGFTQDDISNIFKDKKYPSPSTSSIEKRINKLKYFFKAQNSIHLVAITKDMRLI
jgi:DNA-binding NarL/FixJ family response regulator